MKVVVAEKPSVARDIARVLGCRTKADGHLTGNGYAVTWAFGHLVEIAEPSAMNPDWAKPWRRDQLPMIPSQWQYTVTKDGKKQFAVIKKLLAAREATEIIAATDAGREGEHIFRLIYQLSASKKPVKRLWVSSLTDEAIRDGFRSLKPSSAFDALAAAARARAQADWLMGLNFTRAYTIHNRQLCTVGRVQTPTLALLVNRQHEIESFIPQTYYEVHAILEPGFTARYIGKDGKTRIDDKALAERIVHNIEGVPDALVTSVETKDTKTAAPALFDLLTLQKEANKRFGFTATETLELAQSLYESRKLISYPRTESRHLSRDIVPGLPSVIAALVQTFPEAAALAKDRFPTLKLAKTYVDDTKLTDHHAIIPTPRNPEGLGLSEKERKLYRLVAARFLAIFLPPLVKAETAALFAIGPHTFRAKGSVVKEAGWTIVEPIEPIGHVEPDAKQAGRKEGHGEIDSSDEEQRETLPHLEKDQRLKKRSQSLETRITKPPKPYTDASLLDAMKKAGASIDDEDLAAYMKQTGLGTPATRAAIIERLLKTGYTQRRKKELVPTQKGIDLVAQIQDELKDPALTAQWEQRLKDIEEGTLTANGFEADVVRHVKELLPRVFDGSPIVKADAPGLGACPLCKKGIVRETPKAYGCSRWKEGCSFTIWKNIAGKSISATQAQELLVRKKTRKLKGFTSKKTGRKFDAALALDESFKVTFVFDTPSGSSVSEKRT
jgi:DNA topoisomerase-3